MAGFNFGGLLAFALRGRRLIFWRLKNEINRRLAQGIFGWRQPLSRDNALRGGIETAAS